MDRAIDYFDRQVRLRGATGWTAGILRAPHALLLASPELEDWTHEYDRRGYSTCDPVFHHGRSGGDPENISLLLAEAEPADVTEARKKVGLDHGLVIPLLTAPGSFITIFTRVDVDPESFAWSDFLAFAAHLGVYGEFLQFGRRVPMAPTVLTEREAEICRRQLAGVPPSAIADDLGISVGRLRKLQVRIRQRLIDLGYMASDGPPSRAPIVAFIHGLIGDP